ncbi:MAG TPA: hypothetical protein PKY08_00155 [Candidatus Magasanikbacteria bacterium]|nr:hypothetical protein [Candidatus Magasanikbacteria bacterium]
MNFGSLMSYNYNDNPSMKHGAAFLLTFVLFLDFIGGFYSGILGKKWVFIVIIIWSFWKHRKYLGQAVKLKLFDEIIRDIVSFVITLIFVFVFWLGYFAGPKNWWWICAPVLALVYWLIVKFVQKPYSGH